MAHSDGGPSGRHQGLVYFPKLHPMTGASDDQSPPVTGSGRVNKKTHIRTTQPDTDGRVGGSQRTPSGENSDIVATGNPRGRTTGGGTVPTGTHFVIPRVSNGMGPIKPSPSGSTETWRRKNDKILAPFPYASQEMW